MSKQIDIIIVNWNAGLLTLQAIGPYIGFNNGRIRCNVIVVDNASTDGSESLIKDKLPNTIFNRQNVGFSRACNQALQYCNGDYLLLLNADTESDPSTLEKLVLFLENHPDYGTAGPQQKDRQGNILRTCARFPTFATSLYEVTGLSKIFSQVFTPAPLMTDWDHRQSADVDQVMGSYMLIRRSVLTITGFMDEAYFVYAEDRDLSKRIREAGFKTYYDTSCSIIHDREAVNSISATRLFYSLMGRRIYWKKHLDYAGYLVLVTLSILVEPFLRVFDSIVKEKRPQLKIFTRAYSLYIGQLFKR